MRAVLQILVLLSGSASAADRPDLLLADFEGDAYPAGWKTTGTAFGKGPAKGTLPNQMPVSGFLGKGLVNSYLGGDGSTGTLTSPPFKIERRYLNFLVGGGKHPKTRVDLLVGGKAVRTATGPNDKPGGSERLDWHTWDVAEFEGKDAIIEIVDGETGGWGHINADHFVQSDTRKQAERVTRHLGNIDQQYLHLPVKTGAPLRRVQLVVRLTRDGGAGRTVVEDEIVREFDIELADGQPDYWAFADVSAFRGQRLLVRTVLPADSKALESLKLADDVPDAEKLYREKHRPLFHFTSRFGWLNDPNGLVYHDGEWHLFYQHNPFGVNWGNMHWGHAVSKDLVRWKELGIGLYPKKYGDWAFSGSAIVDTNNTSGWGTKEKPPLVLAYTSTGRGECIAFSNDKGRTWTEYDRNPVVKHAGRDPKLVWYEKGKHWVMAVYDEHDKKQWIAFYTSPDLKTWTFASRIEGFFECPDLFELPVGEDGKHGSKWILYAADGKYVVGEFDGKQFKPDHKEKKQLWYGNFYAAQTFDSAPFGPPYIGPDSQVRMRRIQIGWARDVTFPGLPFNQQMTVPVELGLCNAGKGANRDLRLWASPVEELRNLYEPKSDPVGRTVAFVKPRTLADDLDAFDLSLTAHPSKSTGFTLDLRGTKLVCDTAKCKLTCKDVSAPLPDPGSDGYRLRVLVDRGSVEVFSGGTVAMSIAAIPDEKSRKLELIPHGGEVQLTVRVSRMKSAWEK
jgi:fructan beta-fructosidase